MNFKNWLFNEEIWQGNVATVYHRTKPKDIPQILTTSFNAGAGTGCLYGCGLYTTFSIQSQFTEYMNQYGKSIIKFKVTNLDQFLILHKSVAKQILGQNYKISSQLERLGLKDLYEEEDIKEFDSEMEIKTVSADLAIKMYSANFQLAARAKGIIYYGRRDGYCLLKYPPIEDGSITMLGYAESAPADDITIMKELEQGKGWVTSAGKMSIRSVYNVPEEERQSKVPSAQPQQTVTQKMMSATNKDAMAKFIIQKYPNLNDTQIQVILSHSPDKDSTINALINKKININEETLEYILDITQNRENVINSLVQNNLIRLNPQTFKLIMKFVKNQAQLATTIFEKNNKMPYLGSLIFYMTDEKAKNDFVNWIIDNHKQIKFESNTIQMLLGSTEDPQKVIKFIVQNAPQITDLYLIMDYATNKDEVVNWLTQRNIEIDTDVVRNYMNNYSDPTKIAEYIIANKKEFDGDDTEYILYNIPNEQKPKIINLFLKSGKPLNSDALGNLLYHETNNQDQLVEDIIKTRKLDYLDVQTLLHHSTNKEKTAELLGPDNFDKLGVVTTTDLIRYADDKLRMARIVIQYKNTLTPHEAEFINHMLEPEEYNQLSPEEKRKVEKSMNN